jgi:hypothetical protein
MYESLTADGFKRGFGNLFNTLFCGTAPRKASFRNEHWTYVLMFLSFLQSKTAFQTFCRAPRRVGDTEMVLTNLDWQTPHYWTCVVSCDFESYVAAMSSIELSWLMTPTTAMFGPSGNWGAILDQGGAYLGVFTKYAVVGGEPQFMEELISSQGGMVMMRERFVRFLFDAEFPVSGELRTSLLSDVGW